MDLRLVHLDRTEAIPSSHVEHLVERLLSSSSSSSISGSHKRLIALNSAIGQHARMAHQALPVPFRLYSQAKQPPFQTSTKPLSPLLPLDAACVTFTAFSKQ